MEAYEKDKGKFLDVALQNTALYVKRDVRNALNDCCLKHLKEPRDTISDPYLREFQDMCDSLAGQYPEWFSGSIIYDDPPFHLVSNLNLRAEKRLKFLQKQEKTISEEFRNHAENLDKIKTENQSSQLILSKFVSTLEKVIWTALIAGAIILGLSKLL